MDKPKRGRPRLSGQRRPGNTPAEEILDAAAELFTTLGYANTTTRRIAESVGITQSALYHHFSTKDDILDGLLNRTVADAALVAKRLMLLDIPASTRLYAIAYYDSYQLLVSPWNMGVLFALPETHGEKFTQSHTGREYLRDCYQTLASDTIRELGGAPPSLITVNLPFYFVEMTQQMRTDKLPAMLEAGPRKVSEAIADVALGALGFSGDLAELHTQALAHLPELDLVATQT